MSANPQLFAVGSRAEVSSDEVGFRGSWYVATVVNRRRNQALVKYDTLLDDENSNDMFSEWTDVSYLRPLPPPDDDDNADFQVFEVVDGYTRDGWWTGEVIRVLEGGEGKKKFVVFFENVPEEIRFERAELRSSRKWVDGKWYTFPKKRNDEDEYTSNKKRRKVKKQKEFEECEGELKHTKSRTAQWMRMNKNVNDPTLSNMCHQCQRSDKGPVVRCTKCKRKRYCVSCMKWYRYRKMKADDFAKACPVCLGICNCKSCLRLESPNNENKKFKLKFSNEEKVQYSTYILSLLLPYVRQFYKKQIIEMQIEASRQGLSLSEIKVQTANCKLGERINCNNCKASIADLHRSCSRCSYDLCLICCRELRDGRLEKGHEEVIMKLTDPGVDYLHGGHTCCPMPSRTGPLGIPDETSNSTAAWKPYEDGCIPCPPKKRGGCGQGILELKHMLPKDWVSGLLVRAEEIYKVFKLTDFSVNLDPLCSCFKVMSEIDIVKDNSRKASSREDSDDNYIYCPSAGGDQPGDWKHFKWHWIKGQPVIVRDVLESTSGLSWDPMVMWRAFRQITSERHTKLLDIITIDCLDWCEVDINAHQFFKGYSRGRFDKYGWPEVLKLSDWPKSSSIKEHLPRHDFEFISCLPFKQYTHPNGYLNLIASSSKEGLGPKIHIAYGVFQELGRGDSVTKIHCNAYDEVNVLTHTEAVSFTASQLINIENLKQKHCAQDQREIFKNDQIANVAEKHYNNFDDEKVDAISEASSIRDGVKVNENGVNIGLTSSAKNVDTVENKKGGALWDVFRRQDAHKLEQYLQKHCKEFRHTYCFPLEQVIHPIHDQSFYLSMEHKKRLKEEYGIEPWTFVQKLGDAVLIPAGCPYQVRNLQSCINVVNRFVSPESVCECIHVAESLRGLTQNHMAKKDKIEVKKLVFHALRKSVDDLLKLTLCPVNADESLRSSKSSHAGLEESNYQDGGSSLKQEVSYYLPDEESNQGSSESELGSLSEDGQAGYHSSLPDKKGVTDKAVLRPTSSLREIHTSSSSSPVLCHRNPNSLPADTVGYFKQLEEMLQHNKFNHVLPPEIQLDGKTIKDYKQILKRGLAGQLRQLVKGTNYQEFNEVLTSLLACRSIPTSLYQGFLSLRQDLPILAIRAFELNKKVTDGMIARAKMEELEKYMETYHEFGDSLIKLEHERESNLSEIVRLQARNEVIDAEITKFTAEAKEMQKISASYSHNIASLKAMEMIDEAVIKSSMDALCDLEFEWRNRVAMLEY